MFKKAQVVMLPTNHEARIHQHPKGMMYQSVEAFIQASQAYKSFHLYFLSNDEIKESDWMMDLRPLQYGRIVRCAGKSKLKGFEHYYKDVNNIIIDTTQCKKIIATTNETLFTHQKESPSLPERVFYLPRPSQGFIEVFVREYNKGNVITNVMVEYEEYAIGNYGLSDGEPAIDIRLKVDKDNYITIKKVKDSYSREEVIAFAKKYAEVVWNIRHNNGSAFFDNLENKWIEENL